LMSAIITKVEGSVGIATLNRPEALNALNTELLNELTDALEAWDRGTDVRCMIVTGSDRAFAAGADIKEMAPKGFSDMHRDNLFGAQFDRIARIRKPIIAAVAGHALGGGCELALACDFIIAAETAKFGQPEITLGVMPGLGGAGGIPDGGGHEGGPEDRRPVLPGRPDGQGRGQPGPGDQPGGGSSL
jgi:enoyl-CoA hydratase/carnithine racemase